MAIVMGPCWTNSFSQKLKRRILARFGFNRTALRATETTLDVLRPVFGGRIISRRADAVWRHRSCDLTPFDYYLWGAVKDKCYAAKLDTVDALMDNICGSIMCLKVGTILSVGYCLASRGSHLNKIIFHY